MLNRYLFGRVTRANPDGKGFVFLVHEFIDRAGGAGAVPAITAAMERMYTTSVGTKNDHDGWTLRKTLKATNVACHLSANAWRSARAASTAADSAA
jgi:bifunctional ADP-heptose synthase (sugar kinase/adenylyltransferase)